MTRILVLSDTHIPRAAGDMPAAVYDAVESADMIFHTGDFTDPEVLEKLKGLKPTKAVCGNMDSERIKTLLNAKEIVDVEGVKIGLMHGYGAPSNMIEVARREFKGVDAVVFGHTHRPMNTVKDGILFFNAGSSTDKVFAPYNSYGILEVSNGKIKGKIVRI